MSRISVFVVDDQNLFRQSLALLIKSIDNFDLAGEFESGDAFLAKVPSLPPYLSYIALVDLDMPGINGMEVTKIINEKYPRIKVIVLTVHVNATLISQMINGGACAYLAKNCDSYELKLAIETVNKNGFYFNRQVLYALQKTPRSKKTVATDTPLNTLPVDLTPRELEVLLLICYEYTSAEISEKLYISQRTVEGYKQSLLTKTGARTIAGLVLFALKHGLFNAVV